MKSSKASSASRKANAAPTRQGKPGRASKGPVQQSFVEDEGKLSPAAPSRKSAEPINREERQRLLDRVTSHGYIDDYSGIRISSSGKRFLIENAIVWDLVDHLGGYHGQAAVFDKWSFL